MLASEAIFQDQKAQIRSWPCLRHRPHWGSLRHSPDPIIGWRKRHQSSPVFQISLKSQDEQNKHQLEWANAQRDGRPAKYRWRPLFKAAKFG